MSRRQLPKGGPWERRPSQAMPSGDFAFFGARVLAREAVIGGVLWGCRSTHARFDVAAGVVCLILAVLGTRWFGIIQPRGWKTAWKEVLPLFVGACCVANILLFVFGLAPWFLDP